ncbi:hypothetical protein Hdeb2414_s0007g00244391 [Helianthus debilis subsp. tardiflorus]
MLHEYFMSMKLIFVNLFCFRTSQNANRNKERNSRKHTGNETEASEMHNIFRT